MSCTPEQLLHLAKQQLDHATSDEAVYRSVIHLAYYAFFAVALDFVVFNLAHEINGEAQHGKLSAFLRGQKNRQFKAIGMALRDAFDLHVDADYRLLSNISHEDATLHYEKCVSNIELIRALQQKFASSN